MVLSESAVDAVARGMWSGDVERFCIAASSAVDGVEGLEAEARQELQLSLGLTLEALSALSVASNMGHEAAARSLAQAVASLLERSLDDAGGGMRGMACSLARGLVVKALDVDSLQTAYAWVPGASSACLHAATAAAKHASPHLSVPSAPCASDHCHLSVYPIGPCSEGVVASPRSPKYGELKRILLDKARLHPAKGLVFVRTRWGPPVPLSCL